MRVCVSFRRAVALPTYAQEEALVFLDSTQAAQEAGHHHNCPNGDHQVGSRKGGKAGGEGGKVPLRHRQPDPHAQEPTAAQLKEQTGKEPGQCIIITRKKHTLNLWQPEQDWN